MSATSVRITHGMTTNRLLGDIQRSSAGIASTSAQVSSQKRIQVASDDAVGTGRALRLRSSLAEVDANLDGAAAATGWTTVADTALGSMTDMLHRARELVLQAGNDTMRASDRVSIGGELAQLKAAIKQAANAKFGNAYVFSGQDSSKAAYQSGASDAYGGDTLAVTRTIGPGQSVQINTTGDAILGGNVGDGKLLDTLTKAIAYCNGGTATDATRLRTTTLRSLETNLDQLSTARSTLGATANRVTLAESRLQDSKLELTKGLSDVEDVDYADAMIRLSSQQTAYQAALSAGAKVVQTSLMDFLR